MTEADVLKKMAGARTPAAAREAKRQALEWLGDKDPTPAFTSEMEMLTRLAKLDL